MAQHFSSIERKKNCKFRVPYPVKISFRNEEEIKAMATHSSILAWKIPWMEEPSRLQSMGSLSRTWLSDFTSTFHFHALEREMATHSSVLAWRIPGMGEPGGLLSLGSHRVGHDWRDLAVAADEGKLREFITKRPNLEYQEGRKNKRKSKNLDNYGVFLKVHRDSV